MQGKKFAAYLTGYASANFVVAIWLIGGQATDGTKIILAAELVVNLVIFVMVTTFTIIEWYVYRNTT